VLLYEDESDDFMEITQVEVLDNNLYKDNHYKAVFSYNNDLGIILLDENKVIQSKSPSLDYVEKENILHHKVKVSSIKKALDIDKQYILVSGYLSTYYITNYKDTLYLLRIIIIPTFTKMRMSYQKLSMLFSKSLIFHNGIIQNNASLFKKDLDNLFLISDNIYKINVKYIEYNNSYDVEIDNFNIPKISKEEVIDIINSKKLILK